MNSERGPYTQTRRGLETGSKINRHQWLVGKYIGEQMYVHRDYAHLVIPGEWLQMLAETASAIKFKVVCVMYDRKARTIRGDSSEDFDTAREPHPGWQLTVHRNGKWELPDKPSMTIWHHKWLWVMDDYRGFNTKKSIQWSDTYSPILREYPKATDRTFQEQLREAGFPEDVVMARRGWDRILRRSTVR